MKRRHFNQGLLTIAIGGLATNIKLANASARVAKVGSMLGPLKSDPNGMLDLPEGFSYEVISTLGRPMSDGLNVPDKADGMGCFALDDERVVLVRNHEISLRDADEDGLVLPAEFAMNDEKKKQLYDMSYGTDTTGIVLPGGTSHIIYNLKSKKVEDEFMSLIGTIRNCSGGTTPWQTWLSCEESTADPSDGIDKAHGYVFEVPAKASGLVQANPLREMGRFNHEAACVDPVSGIVYLTEDRHDSLFYRFIPKQKGKLAAGGKLQALAIVEDAQFDTRNWHSESMKLNDKWPCEWLDLDDVESPLDDLRDRGHKQGAALFARGEGIHFGDNEMYFCCTNGGKQKLGQIMRYIPSGFEGEEGESKQPGMLSLFVESKDKVSFNYGDNITIAPNGHLLVCEDQYTKTTNNHLKGVDQNGMLYDFAKVRWQTEPAGVCFSPDGSTLFVNLYSPTATLAIKGPWMSI